MKQNKVEITKDEFNKKFVKISHDLEKIFMDNKMSNEWLMYGLPITLKLMLDLEKQLFGELK